MKVQNFLIAAINRAINSYWHSLAKSGLLQVKRNSSSPTYFAFWVITLVIWAVPVCLIRVWIKSINHLKEERLEFCLCSTGTLVDLQKRCYKLYLPCSSLDVLHFCLKRKEKKWSLLFCISFCHYEWLPYLCKAQWDHLIK